MFAVGQEIECINDEWISRTGAPCTNHYPKKGDVVHCGGYADTSKYPHLAHLTEPWIYVQEANPGQIFVARYFRAVTKRTTSIEVFKKFETPAPKKLEPV